MNADAMMYLNDDVLLYEDTIDKIITIFEIKYLDFDCLIGLNQVNIDSLSKVKTAFGVIGKKYANRFPNRQWYCPDYYRFYGDKEAEEYAISINKFFYDPSIQIIHLHPCTDLTLIDQTHKEVRKYLKQDEQTFYNRQSLGFLWGRNFQLINN